MYEIFYKNFGDYLIENSSDYLIYLIPGEKLEPKFGWYGEKRAEAFNALNEKSFTSDIEERDTFYTHMMIWDKENMELVGGQRFLFNKKALLKKKIIHILKNTMKELMRN